MESKIIGVILLVCSALIIQYSYDEVKELMFSSEPKLKAVIEKDINNTIEKYSPGGKDNIRYAKFNYRSKEAHEILKKNLPQFEVNKEGSIWLEIEILDLPDEINPGFITQTSIFDVKTKNKIGEFGETYHFKDFPKELKLKTVVTSNSEKPKRAEAAVDKKSSKQKKSNK